MNTQNKLKAGIALLKAAFLNKGTPLAVGWAVTYRCNKKCQYCDLWQKKTPELSTEQIKKIIVEMVSLGTQAISFTGGEPLLRSDIKQLIEFANAQGLFTKINSNGALVPQKINVLKDVGELRLSFDGPSEVQDELRGKDSFKEVIAAARTARKENIKISFNTVLSRHNLGQIEFLLTTAQKFDAQIIFQPASLHVLGSPSRNRTSPLSKKYKEVIQKLVTLKKEGCKYIYNSESGLEHLSRFPELKSVPCSGGLLSCRITPNGDVYHCGRYKQERDNKNCLEVGFKKAFQSLKKFSCDQCACGPRVELSQLLTLNPDAILNLVKKQK